MLTLHVHTHQQKEGDDSHLSCPRFCDWSRDLRFSSVTQLCLTLCSPMDCSTPDFPCPSSIPRACSNSCPSSHWCHPTISSSVIPFSSCLQSFPESGSFPVSCSSHQVTKYWSFSFSVSPSNEYSGLDWLDLLTVQGVLKSLLQHHSSKASILQYLGFFIVQLSHPYMTTRKTIALTRQTFVGKVMSLLFNMLFRLVIAFLPRTSILISWLQSPSAVILEPPPNKVCHCFHCFPIYLPWSDGIRCHNLSFLNVEF